MDIFQPWNAMVRDTTMICGVGIILPTLVLKVVQWDVPKQVLRGWLNESIDKS
jgi:hypothetical protein